MNRYVTYKRVSSKEQGKSGLGLDAQERDIHLFLESYSEEPWEVVGEFVEVQSGADDGRPELTKAIDLAKKMKATLLVSKLDRLSRRVSFISRLIEDKRLSFRVAQMPMADKFQLHIYAALAEQERDFISHRTKSALREAKSRGVVLGGLRDTTNRRNQAVKEQADERAEALRKIVAPMQGQTLQTIADALNTAGIRTARGAAWTPTQVARVQKRLEAQTSA